MKKTKKWVIGLMIILCMLIGGCGGHSSSVNETQENTGETRAEDEYKPAKDAVILMTVGDSVVTKEEALFYIYQLKSKYGDSLGSGLWNMDIGDGQKLGEYALEETKRHIMEINIICQTAKEQGVFLLDEEKEEARQKAQQYMSGLSSEAESDFGITRELVEKIYRENMLASKMYDVTTAKVTGEISDEDARCADIQYIQVMIKGSDGDAVKKEQSGEDLEDARNRAKNLLKSAKKSSDFKSFAQTNTEAPEVELTISKGDGPEDIEAAALSLHTGEFSDVVEGKEGYYIIYCVNESNEEEKMKKKEELINKAQDEKFMEEYTKWSQNYRVVVSGPEWENLKF